MINKKSCPCCRLREWVFTNKKSKLLKQLRNEKHAINKKSRNDMIYNNFLDKIMSKQLTYGFSGINT